MAFFGALSFPFLPMILEVITRKFSFIPLDILNTALFSSSQIFSIISIAICGVLLNDIQWASALIIVILMFFYVFILFFVHTLDKDVKN